MDGLFSELDDKGKFVAFITERYQETPPEIRSVMHCNQTLDPSRIEYAFNEYQQNLQKFAVLLHSKNPDHYKRSGALLHALQQSEIIASIDLESSADELTAGFTRVGQGDADAIAPFVKFYEEYNNQFRAFDLAFRCCSAYEADDNQYSFEYLHNVCRYLKMEPNLSVDSLFMLFKSLMHECRVPAKASA